MERLAELLTPHVDLQRRCGWLLVASVLLGLMAAAQTWPMVALGLRVLLGRFVYSTSNASVLLALATFLVVALMNARSAASPTPKESRGFRWPLITLLAIGHAAHLAALLLWSRDVGLARHRPHLVFSDGEQSFTALTHSHLGKTGLALLAEHVGLATQLADYDLGAPLAEFVPAPLALVIALACATALGLLVANWPSVRDKKPHDPWRSVAYLLSGLACVQLVADGGPLSLRFGPSVAILLSTLVARPGERWCATLRRGAFPFSVLVASHLLVWSLLASRPLSLALASSLPLLAAYALLVLGSEASRSPAPAAIPSPPSRRTLAHRLALIAALTILASGWLHDWRRNVAPLLRTLDDRIRVVCIDLDRLEIETACPAQSAQTPLAAYARRGNPMKPQDVFLARERGTPPDPGAYFAIGRTQIGGPPGRIGGGGLFEIESILPGRPGLDGWILHARSNDARLPQLQAAEGGDIIDRQNRYVWLRVLDAALRRGGVHAYLLLRFDVPSPSGSTPARERFPHANPATTGAGRARAQAETADQPR